MKLTEVRVQNYKSIDDSGWVGVEDVTCLVGKNESGKTAFLQALGRLNPVEGQPSAFDHITEYPRQRSNRYKAEHDQKPAEVVAARFELDDADLDELPGALSGALKNRTISLTKRYNNTTYWGFSLDQTAVVKSLVAGAELPEANAEALRTATTVEELSAQLTTLGADPPQAATLLARINQWNDGDPDRGIMTALSPRVPRFFYFDDYAVMRGRISVPDLKAKRDREELDDADQTFLALLRFVGTQLEEFESQANYERLKADLEAASNEISDELFEFWSQNKNLAVEFNISGPDDDALPPLNQGTNLHVRIRNNRHRVSVPFDQRSRGFVWFFSFLAYFSELDRKKGQKLVLLLDEPALSLHAKAQEDFLRFMDERVSPEYQVIYSTHSPFMVDPAKLKSVRTVEDKETGGTQVSDQVFRSSSDTLFPLQAALGYELAQTLFVAPNNLLVEGPSELVYLPFLSEAARQQGLEQLDEKWVIVPVGGIDKIATFVSLLGGNRLNTSVLIDVSSKDQQRVQNLRDNGHLGKHSLIQIGEVTGATDADIEDIFEPSFYMLLVNGAYSTKLSKKLALKDLDRKRSLRIVKQVEHYFRENDLGGFSHFAPASYLLREQESLLPKLADATIARGSKLFERINKTLK